MQSVVDDVAEVQPFWAQLPPADRARYMRRAAQAIIDYIDELPSCSCREQGKPRNESYAMELLPTIDALHWVAEAGPGILEDERMLAADLPQAEARAVHLRAARRGGRDRALELPVVDPVRRGGDRPDGRQRRGAQAGVPDPLIGQRIQQVFERAGLPEGLVRTVHGGGAVGQALVESSAAKIFFTGSVEVGRGVGEACAERMKGSVLELGGKDPMIVLADANLPNAVRGGLWGGFANAGQTCSGIERVYVMREVAERFVEAWWRARAACGWATRLDWDDGGRARWSRASSSTWSRELVDDAVAPGASCTAAARWSSTAHAGRSTRRRCSPA